ncbi:MAG: hypothetical protein AAFR61_17040 [Bacteroidota bacterium]
MNDANQTINGYSIFDAKMHERTRKEAESVKDCFTRFSFQAIVFTAAMIGVIGKFSIGLFPEILISIATIILLLTVARIGTYKYASANRLFGFELFADQVRADQLEVPNMGWEQAILAWRVVQATLFDHFHYTRNNNRLRFRLFQPYRIKGDHRFYRVSRKGFLGRVFKHKRRKRSLWFELDTYPEIGSVYHAGGYLRTMLKVLNTLAAVVLLLQPLLLWRTYTNATASGSAAPLSTLELSIYLGLLTLIFIGLMYRLVLTWTQLQLLEKGFLSIHTSGILWHVVAEAHKRTQAVIENSDSLTNANYMSELSKIAVEIKDTQDSGKEDVSLPTIHDWINKPQSAS